MTDDARLESVAFTVMRRHIAMTTSDQSIRDIARCIKEAMGGAPVAKAEATSAAFALTWHDGETEWPDEFTRCLCQFTSPADQESVVGICRFQGNEFLRGWYFGNHAVAVKRWCYLACVEQFIQVEPPAPSPSDRATIEVEAKTISSRDFDKILTQQEQEGWDALSDEAWKGLDANPPTPSDLTAELAKREAEIERLNANEPFADADGRIAILKLESGSYEFSVPGCSQAPFTTWREAYRAAEGLLDYQESMGKVAKGVEAWAALTAELDAARAKGEAVDAFRQWMIDYRWTLRDERYGVQAVVMGCAKDKFDALVPPAVSPVEPEPVKSPREVELEPDHAQLQRSMDDIAAGRVRDLDDVITEIGNEMRAAERCEACNGNGRVEGLEHCRACGGSALKPAVLWRQHREQSAAIADLRAQLDAAVGAGKEREAALARMGHLRDYCVSLKKKDYPYVERSGQAYNDGAISAWTEAVKLLSPAPSQADAATEKPQRPPMLLAKQGNVRATWGWFVRCGDEWWLIPSDLYVAKASEFLEIDRERSDPEAMRLYDKDLADAGGER